MTKKFWQCELKIECKARIHTNVDDTSVVKTINNHSHTSDPAKITHSKLLKFRRLFLIKQYKESLRQSMTYQFSRENQERFLLSDSRTGDQSLIYISGANPILIG
ncbi:hypothetical protein MXB_2973 [Myxobolus squamalis]|nr:hypothetical protein MXB_2973 [Myxobolus squamalis]